MTKKETTETKFKVAGDGSLLVTLSDGTAYKVREPRGKDTRAMSRYAQMQPNLTNTDAGFFMITQLTEPVAGNEVLTLEALDEMKMSDVELLGEAIATFRSSSGRP